MSKILLKTTIPEHPDDWDIGRFALLADELRSAGHEATARNWANRGHDDPVLGRVDELGCNPLQTPGATTMTNAYQPTTDRVHAQARRYLLEPL